MKRDVIESFIKVQSQMEEMYNEVSVLSKKSQNDALNEFKLFFVNELLQEANRILEEKYIPFKSFSIFHKDKMPTNSDVVMVLSQYLTCLENMRVDNIFDSIDGWHWIVGKNGEPIKTTEPKK
ncbi:MAG: hypothetical protein LBG93_05010 [Treponema sp.]|nr:hypothetical protein [Treponema sp.]